MIQGRCLKDFLWEVFQSGHFGWWYTNGDSVVCRQAFETEKLAKEAMKKEKLGGKA